MDTRQAFLTGIAHHQAGRLAEAEAIYRQILSANPNHVDSLHLLGVIANQRGQTEAAIDLIERALRQKPAAEIHNNLGLAYRAAGRTDNALANFERAIALKPGYPEALLNWAAVLEDTKQWDKAQEKLQKALALRPDYVRALYGMAHVFQSRGQPGEAIPYYEKAIALKPDYVDAHNNLAVVLKDQGKLDQAAARCRHLIGLSPNYPSAHYNLGLVLEEQGDLDGAIASYQTAIALNPDYAEAHWNLALLLLLKEDFAAGWREYEWRWRMKSSALRSFSKPLWNGEDIAGRTILLHAEQGYGDTIQFIRYAALVKARGATVIVETPPSLKRLLQNASGIDQLIVQGEVPPPFDVHAPLLSLPRIFGTTVETTPAQVPYLTAQPDIAAAWRARLGERPGMKAGLAWRGNPGNSINHRKSIPPEIAASLLSTPGIAWISLQADAKGEEVAAISTGGPIMDTAGILTDWADTAALISELDVVVTVDTGVAHLAGALGKPVLVLASYIPDWRWLLHRTDSPWYPTVTLFRQSAPGDWSGPLEALRRVLETRAAP